MIATAALSACGQPQPKPEEPLDPARLVGKYTDLLVGKCAFSGTGFGTEPVKEEQRKACLEIAMKKIGGADCVKMAETGLQKHIDPVAAGRCEFQYAVPHEQTDVLTELRVNEREIRACLANDRACKRLEDEHILVLSEHCNSFAFWASQTDALVKTEKFTMDHARTMCVLWLDAATKGVAQ